MNSCLVELFANEHPSLFLREHSVVEDPASLLWGDGKSHVINFKSVSHHHITLSLNSNLFPFSRAPFHPRRRATVGPVSKRWLSAEHQTSVDMRQMVFDQRNLLLSDAQDLVTVYTQIDTLITCGITLRFTAFKSPDWIRIHFALSLRL
jgi:hypothetical protein